MREDLTQLQNGESRSNTLKSTVLLGIFFLFLITTYASFSNIVSFMLDHSQNQYPFVGQVALITNYATFLLGLTFAPALGNYKKQFLVASLCYSINYALYVPGFTHVGGLLVAVAGGVIGGYGASVVWISQGGYMVQLFKLNSIKSEEEGKYMGILNAFVFLTVLAGAAIITFTLGFFPDRIYFAILTGLGVLAFLHCYFFIPKVEQRDQSSEEVNCQVRVQQILSFFKFYPKMKYMLIPMVLDGFILGFVTTDLSLFLPESLREEVDVGILLMVHGVGAAIGGYFSGSLSDHMRISLEGTMLFIFMAITFGLSLVRESIAVSGFTFPLVLGFMWGLSLYFLEGWIFVSCTKIYSGEIETYAVAKQMHTVSFIVFQLYQVLFRRVNVVKYTIILLLLLSILSGAVSYFLLSRRESLEGHVQIKQHQESLVSEDN